MKIAAGTPAAVLAATLWTGANGATPMGDAAASAPEHTPIAQARAQAQATVAAIENAQGPWQREPQEHDATTVALKDAIRAMRGEETTTQDSPGAPAPASWEGVAQTHHDAASIAYLAAAALGGESAHGTPGSGADTERKNQDEHERGDEKSSLRVLIERSLKAWKGERTGDGQQTENGSPENPWAARPWDWLATQGDGATSAQGQGAKQRPPQPPTGEKEDGTTGKDLMVLARTAPWGQWARTGIYAYAACAMIIMGAMGLRTVRRRTKWRKSKAAKRLEQVAGPLRSSARDETASAREGGRIFRTKKRKGVLGALWEPISRAHPMITPKPTMIACGVGATVACATVIATMWVLKIDAGWANTTIWATGALIGAWNGLKWRQRRTETAFVRQFPEVVDQIVRLAGAGVPATEALSVIANDVKEPTRSVLKEVSDGMNAGLDTDEALRITTERVKMTEFSMFAAVLRLQKQAGGSLSQAFDNLAKRLRDRRKSALKAHNATSQTRLTIVVLAIMPLAVLLAQKIMSPEQVDKLLTTDTGTLLLRWGIALIASGIIMARTLANRAARAR